MSTAIILTGTARSAIVSSFVEALTTNESTGSLVTQVCDTAHKYLKGADMSDDDRKAIVADITKAKGWKGASVKARSSECNVVLRAYAKLPEAIQAYRNKARRVQWHDSMKLARRLNAGDSIAAAVRSAFTTGTQSKKSTPSGRVAGALKAWFKSVPAKRDAILKAAALLNIKLGVKLDA